MKVVFLVRRDAWYKRLSEASVCFKETERKKKEKAKQGKRSSYLIYVILISNIFNCARILEIVPLLILYFGSFGNIRITAVVLGFSMTQ